jgi:transcriptional regulator with XRE-family HTH domain
VKKKKIKKRKLIFDATGIKAFAIHLKKLRQEANITQSQLAFEASISLSQIARIETARTNPTLSTIFAISRALDIPLTSMFDFSLPENKEKEKKF